MSKSNSFAKSNNYFRAKYRRHYIALAFVGSFLFNVVIFYLFTFCPDFIFKKNEISFMEYLTATYSRTNLRPWFISYSITLIISQLLSIPMLAFIFFIAFYLSNLNNVIKESCNKHLKILNSCTPSKFRDKIALVVGTCNDFSPNSLLQSANQTYKNIDVWICDDSNNPIKIKEIDDFVKKHRNFYVCRRDEQHKKQHPTKIGNVTYWLHKHGSKYDYVFENDSTSIVTSTFVENSLCYFHAPILSNMKINCINCNGNFYYANKLISKVNSFNWQLSNEIFRAFTFIDGDKVFNDGWCALYKTSTLMQIPLKNIECTSCDSARGAWLSKHGYKSIMNPFDFAGKIGIQNMQAYKRQRTKWHSADIFIWRKNMLFNSKDHILWNLRSLVFFILPIPIFVNLLIQTIILFIIKINYVNFTSLLLIGILGITISLVLIIFSIFNYKQNVFKFFLFLIVSIILESTLLYKRWINYFFILLFKKKQNKWYVTNKNLIGRTTFFNKLKSCAVELCVLIFHLILWIIISIKTTDLNSNINHIVNQITKNFSLMVRYMFFWTFIFPIFTLPSFFYIVFTFIGEIKIKNGYDPNSLKQFPIEKYDFRYKFIEEFKIKNKMKFNKH